MFGRLRLQKLSVLADRANLTPTPRRRACVGSAIRASIACISMYHLPFTVPFVDDAAEHIIAII